MPDERYRSILDSYRDAAQVIEASGLDYTVLRPGWLQDRPASDFTLTRKGKPFIGHAINLDSLSGLIAMLATTPGLHVGESLGISDQ